MLARAFVRARLGAQTALRLVSGGRGRFGQSLGNQIRLPQPDYAVIAAN